MVRIVVDAMLVFLPSGATASEQAVVVCLSEQNYE
jgi:hypothetical protein